MPTPRLTALALVVALSWSRIAVAQTAPWSLAWSAPAECPTEASLRASIGALVGARASSSPVRMTARVTLAAPARWTAELTTESRGAVGTRSLEAASCRELAEAVTVILAWMLDPSMQQGVAPLASGVPSPGDTASAPSTPVPEPSTTVSEPSATVSEPSTPVSELSTPVSAPPRRGVGRLSGAVASPARARRAWRLRVGVGARGDLGPLPAFAVGPELWASITRGRWRFTVDGSWRPTMRRELPSAPSRGGDFDLWTLGVNVCRRWIARPVTPALCGGVEGGSVSAVGFGVTRPGSDRHPWVALSAGGALDVAVTAGLALSAKVALEVPVVRPDFVLEQVGAVFQSSAVGLRAGIGAEVIF